MENLPKWLLPENVIQLIKTSRFYIFMSSFLYLQISLFLNWCQAEKIATKWNKYNKQFFNNDLFKSGHDIAANNSKRQTQIEQKNAHSFFI